MNTDFWADIDSGIIEQKWFLSAYRFAAMPACYIDCSWLEPPVTGSIWQRVRQNPEVVKALSAHLLQRLDLPPVENLQLFSERFMQICLADAEVWKRLILHLGLIAHGGAIRRVICCIQQRRLIEQVGEVEYRFALKNSHFFVNNELFLEKFCSESLLDGEPIGRQLNTGGCRIAALALSGAPPSVAKRLACKLPKEQGACLLKFIEATPVHNDNLIAAARELMIKLCAEIATEWREHWSLE